MSHRTAGLRHAYGIGHIVDVEAPLGISTDAHGDWPGKRRVGRRGPIHFENPLVHVVGGGLALRRILQAGEVFGSTQLRRDQSVDISRLQAMCAEYSVRRVGIAETLRLSHSAAGQHGGSVKGASHYTNLSETIVRIFKIDGDVITVNPGADLRVIRIENVTVAIGPQNGIQG